MKYRHDAQTVGILPILVFAKKENFELYRFEVRSHWRKLLEGSIGKDRNREYKVESYAWFNEFEKSSKDLPLLQKTRIIK